MEEFDNLDDLKELEQDELEEAKEIIEDNEKLNYGYNWFVIFPYKELEMIKKCYEELGLPDFTTSIIIVNDDLSEEQEMAYISFVNKALRFNGHIGSSKSDGKSIMQTVEDMGGSDGEELYVFKEGKVSHKKVDLSIL